MSSNTGAAFFVADRDSAHPHGLVFQPTEYARSRWGNTMLSGPAIVGLAAWALENNHSEPNFLPTRITVDLFKAARFVPSTTQTRLIRDGHRIRMAECEIMQDGMKVAQANVVQYRQSQAPPGQQWVPQVSFTPPPDVHGNAFFIGSDDAGWDQNGHSHQNASRKRFYHNSIDVISGQRISRFVRAVVVAEATNLVTHLGTHGVGYINGDLTVALSRLPVSEFIGVQADSHWSAQGISVGSATLFDETGPFGIGLISAIANPQAQITIN